MNPFSAVSASSSQSHASLRALASRSPIRRRSEEHTSELQSRRDLVCRLLLEKKKTESTIAVPGRQDNLAHCPVPTVCGLRPLLHPRRAARPPTRRGSHALVFLSCAWAFRRAAGGRRAYRGCRDERDADRAST